jgi:long-chain acyl-CoA synthetase
MEATVYPGTYAQSTPDKPAIIVPALDEAPEITVTYAELDERSLRLARVLREAGLDKGDHIAYLSDNRPEVFEVYWAALRSGMYITGINHHLSSEEAAYIVNDCGARALVVSAGTADLATAVVEHAPGVEIRLAFGGPVDGYDDYAAALAKVSAEPLGDQPRGADMLYSSGTTGRPKGIKPTLPDRQVDEPGDMMVAVFGQVYRFDADTVYYSPAPVYHAAPLRFGGIVQSLGGTLVMARKFDATASLAAIDKYGVTHSQWVPTMFVRMLKLPDEVRESYDVSSLTVAVHAAAPCPVDVKNQMIDWWGPILEEYYGSTEGNGVTMINSGQWREKPGSVGKAGLGIIHICDDDTDGAPDLPTGEVGTVFFEREEVAFGYHNDPEKTRAGQHPEHENWSSTGDVGYLDSDGFLYLTDRKAFLIISGGVNIYPQEIEDCLTLHPKVFDVAVIGIPDPEMGEQVKAIVQAAEGVETGPGLEAELMAFVRARIARYKCPRSIDFTGDLPRSATGKLVKHVLKARYQH